jgi:hypothetical protein
MRPLKLARLTLAAVNGAAVCVVALIVILPAILPVILPEQVAPLTSLRR